MCTWHKIPVHTILIGLYMHDLAPPLHAGSPLVEMKSRRKMAQ
jgi:hypothetical protein